MGKGIWANTEVSGEENLRVALLNVKFFLQAFCNEEVVLLTTSRWHCVLMLGKAKPADR